MTTNTKTQSGGMSGNVMNTMDASLTYEEISIFLNSFINAGGYDLIKEYDEKLREFFDI